MKCTNEKAGVAAEALSYRANALNVTVPRFSLERNTENL